MTSMKLITDYKIEQIKICSGVCGCGMKRTQQILCTVWWLRCTASFVKIIEILRQMQADICILAACDIVKSEQHWKLENDSDTKLGEINKKCNYIWMKILKVS